MLWRLDLSAVAKIAVILLAIPCCSLFALVIGLLTIRVSTRLVLPHKIEFSVQLKDTSCWIFRFDLNLLALAAASSGFASESDSQTVFFGYMKLKLLAYRCCRWPMFGKQICWKMFLLSFKMVLLFI